MSQQNQQRQPACPYCSGTSAFLVASTDFNRETTDESFFYYKCLVCGLVFMDPIPGDMSPFYKDGYEPIPATLEELRVIASREKYRLEPIVKYKTGGSLLEIGPWRGVFCCNAKDAGFQVSAIEMDTQCVAFLNETVGIRAIQSYDPAATLGSLEDRFDVITLWHSLEHLPKPWRVVEEASRRLKRGGLLLISIPNIDSYEFSLLGERWRHLDAPRHLFFFPIPSLVALCKINGFEKVEVTTEDQISRLLARDTWHKWALRKSKSERAQRILLRAAYDFGQWRERKLKDAGSGMTAIFRLS